METKDIIIIAVTASLVMGIVLSIIFYLIIARTKSQTRQQTDRQQEILGLALEVQEIERNLLGEDLEEELGPMLAALRWKTNNLPFEPDTPDSQSIQSFNDMIDRIKDKVKQLSHSLLPPAIIQQGLLAALQQSLLSLGKQTNMRIHFQHSINEVQLENSIAIQVYRIMTELCDMIIRYTEATILEIRIGQEGISYVFSVSDNGKPLSNLSYDTVLKNIAARVFFIRGSFTIQQQIQGGNYTELKVSENLNSERL